MEELDAGKLNDELIPPLVFGPVDEEGNRPDEVLGRSRSNPPSDSPLPPPPDLVLQSSMTESLREVGLGGSSRPSPQSRPERVPGLDAVKGLGGSSSSDEGYGRLRVKGLVADALTGWLSAGG